MPTETTSPDLAGANIRETIITPPSMEVDVTRPNLFELKIHTDRTQAPEYASKAAQRLTALTRLPEVRKAADLVAGDANCYNLGEMATLRAEQELGTHDPSASAVRLEALIIVENRNWSPKSRLGLKPEILTAFGEILEQELREGRLTVGDFKMGAASKTVQSRDSLTVNTADTATEKMAADLRQQYYNLMAIAMEHALDPRLTEVGQEAGAPEFADELTKMVGAAARIETVLGESDQPLFGRLIEMVDRRTIVEAMKSLREAAVEGIRLLSYKDPEAISKKIWVNIEIGSSVASLKADAQSHPEVFEKVAPVPLLTIEAAGGAVRNVTEGVKVFPNETRINNLGIYEDLSQEDFAYNIYLTMIHNLTAVKGNDGPLKELYKDPAEDLKIIGDEIDSPNSPLRAKLNLILSGLGPNLQVDSLNYGITETKPNNQEVYQVALALATYDIFKTSGVLERLAPGTPIMDVDVAYSNPRSSFNIAVGALNETLDQIVKTVNGGVEVSNEQILAASGAFGEALRALRSAEKGYLSVWDKGAASVRDISGNRALVAAVPPVLPNLFQYPDSSSKQASIYYGPPLRTARAQRDIRQGGYRIVPKP